ncbi:MAG: ABC transporter permease [Cyclobacteriaceae bacterium]
MLKNYLITTLRNFRRNSFSTVINVLGLTLSLACCIAIYAFIKHEYSFDNWHQKADRTFRVVGQYKAESGINYQGYVAFPMAEALREEFSEIELATQLSAGGSATIKVEQEGQSPRLFEEDEIAYVDKYFLQTFDYELLAGQFANLLSTPDEVVITQELADKFFGNEAKGEYEQLLGQMLIINQQPFQISGVLENVPRNTNVNFRMLLPLQDYIKRNESWIYDWGNHSSDWATFITLPQGYNAQQLESRLGILIEKNYTDDRADRRSFHLQALPEVHTDERYGGTMYATPSILIVAFVTMGLIVLLTACINFINLSTAQSVKRAKEIGIRKALGSRKRQIVLQFMGETFIITAVASLIAVVLAEEFTQAFNQFLSVVIDYGLELDISVFYFLIGLILVVTMLAGYYPARILSGFKPTEALKQSMSAKNTGFAGKFSLRKTLVVTQFIISQLLIIGTIVVSSQMNYVKERDLGFTKDDIAVVFIPQLEDQNLETFRDKIISQAAVTDVSFSTGPPMSSSNSWTGIYSPAQGEDERFGIEQRRIDSQYLPVFDIQLLAGRNLREEDRVLTSDSIDQYEYNVLLNEKAIAKLGYQSPEEAVGETVIVAGESKVTVVGVVEDFFNAPLQDEIHPLMLHSRGENVWMAAVNLATPQPVQQLSFVEESWKELYPDYYYSAMSLDEYFEYGAFYVIEDVMYQAFRLFAFLSIVIGCMGLYGLVSYLALQRRKEVGVRKTLGATVGHILYLFTKEFTWLVLLAFVIAAPLGYFAMKAWLETFAYQIPLTASYFILAFIVSMLIALVTVGYKSLRAATANPVDSLRNE